MAAIASYLEAIIRDGEWLLRIEDIDPPREMPGAADAIVAALDAHGFRWHGPIIRQSDSIARFESAIAKLFDAGQAYACTCTREQIKRASRTGPTGPVYPGTCRGRGVAPRGALPAAVRVCTAHTHIAFDDRVQGRIACDVECEIGDFIVRRKDHLIAYSLAGALSDHDEGITDVVRGADLLMFTPAQIHVQRLLGLAQPNYCHVPVVTNEAGDKLSKQTGANALDAARAADNLVRGLQFLAQDPPAGLAAASPDEVWAWAREHWCLNRLATGATGHEHIQKLF